MSVLNQRTAPKEVNFSLLCRSTQIQSIKIPAKLQDPMGRVEVIDSSEKLVESRMHGKTTVFADSVRAGATHTLLRPQARPVDFRLTEIRHARCNQRLVIHDYSSRKTAPIITASREQCYHRRRGEPVGRGNGAVPPVNRCPTNGTPCGGRL